MCYLVLGEQDIQCHIILHAHLKIKALPHTTLTGLWKLSGFQWLIVCRVEKLPQKLPTLQRAHSHRNIT